MFDNDDVLSKGKNELHQRFEGRGKLARSCSPRGILLFMDFCFCIFLDSKYDGSLFLFFFFLVVWE